MNPAVGSPPSRQPGLTVVVAFHDMRRQAQRTLFSLSREYQRDVENLPYEVLAIDNGSTEPLDPAVVAGFGPEFRHEIFATESPSPCAALNHAVRRSRYENVLVAIDGARLLSPGLLALAARAFAVAPHPFLLTLGMHLGPQVQNELVASGFSAEDESELLAYVEWRSHGYRLFEISTPAVSSRQGFYSELSESNCFGLRVADYERLGGFDERFVSPGGGVANLDLFNRAMADAEIEPIMLLGEATFHQQHGGVAAEAPLEDHPWPQFMSEYQAIHGTHFVSVWRQPRYLGPRRKECSGLYNENAEPA